MAFTKEQIEAFKKMKSLTKEELKKSLEEKGIKLSDEELEQLKQLISTEDNIKQLCSGDTTAVVGGIGEEMSPKTRRRLDMALNALGFTISAAVAGGLIYANKDRIGKLFGRSNNPVPNPAQLPNPQQTGLSSEDNVIPETKTEEEEKKDN